MMVVLGGPTCSLSCRVRRETGGRGKRLTSAERKRKLLFVLVSFHPLFLLLFLSGTARVRVHRGKRFFLFLNS